MRKAIVTGANGFVGSAVVKELLAHNIEVVALSHSGKIEGLSESASLSIISMELENIFKLHDQLAGKGFDTFFHFAWAGVSGADRGNPIQQLNNVNWTIDALKLAKAVGCQRFIGAGSIMEHEVIAAVYTAGSKPGMGYVYGAGKLAAHIMCKATAADIGIDLIWAEITNTYGIGERSQRLINTAIQKCMRGESPQFTAGTQNYDFVYIDDVARAFRLIGEKGKPFHEYLIGSSTARPLKEFLQEMQQVIAPTLDFVFGDVPFTGVDMSLEKFDCSNTEKDTGFRATISFGEGCRRTRDWWETILKEE